MANAPFPHTTLRVGITGGIGSGKTTACQIFEALGVPVYYADDRAKWLMQHSPTLREAITELLGTESYLPDGQLNRAYISGKVFNNPEALANLNALVHPAVAKDTEAWEQQYSHVPYTLREAALLFESGSYRKLHRIITITAPEDLRIQRVMQRNATTREAVLARMRQQWPEEEKVKLAHYIINNDGQHSLVRQVWGLHRELVEQATVL